MCERQLDQMRVALMKAERLALAGRFAGGVMHDVNNPLEALGNLIYLAAEDAEDPELVRGYLRLAEEQMAHVQSIARQTLSYYRPYADGTEVDLIEVLESALHMHRPQLMTKRIQVCRPKMDVARLKANPGELLQVFNNLIANSIEALADGGMLHVRVSRSGGHFHILIADNGSGIGEEQMAQMFEPFATSKKAAGTGLGLWMSKSLVEKHKGRIRHRSSTSPGRCGTSFRISLPG